MVDIYYSGGHKQRERLRHEFENQLDPRCQGIILVSAHYLKREFGLPTTVTCVYRSVAENVAVDGSPYSGHMDNRCADTRSRHLLPSQKEQLLAFMKEWYAPEFLQLLHHDSGQGEHFHWGIRYAYRDKPVG